jgi:aspartate/methionine/tyrosine aminotransferase
MRRNVTSVLARDLLAASLRQEPPSGAGLIRLDSGDPDFATPALIVDATKQALHDGYTHYAHPQGDIELREALASQISCDGCHVSSGQIVITHGATAALAAAILATVDPGDRVVLPEPTYSLYADLVLLARGEPVFVRCPPPNFPLDIDAIERAAADAKLIVVCNPCNPTGTVYPPEQIEALVGIAEARGALMLSDEAYADIVYDGVRFASAHGVGSDETVLYVQSFSKSHAMTGWRLGYIVASSATAPAIARLHRTMNGPINAAVQKAVLPTFAATWRPWQEQVLRDYTSRRKLVYDAFAGASDGLRAPDGTFYFWLRHPPGVTSDAMAKVALDHGVSVRPGSEFGPSGEGYVRIAFTVEQAVLAEGIQRLKMAFAQVAENSVAGASYASEVA